MKLSDDRTNFVDRMFVCQFVSEEQWNAVARDVRCGMESETQLHV